MADGDKKADLSWIFDTPCSLCGGMFTKRGLIMHQSKMHSTVVRSRRKVTGFTQINLRPEIQSLNLRPGDTVLVKEEHGSIIITPYMG